MDGKEGAAAVGDFAALVARLTAHEAQLRADRRGLMRLMIAKGESGYYKTREASGQVLYHKSKDEAKAHLLRRARQALERGH